MENTRCLGWISHTCNMKDISGFILDISLIFALIYNSNSVWALAKDQFSLSCFMLLVTGVLYYFVLCISVKGSFQKTITPVMIVMSATLLIQLLVAFVHNGEGLLDGTWFQYMLILPVLLGCLLIRGKEYIYRVFLSRLVYVSMVLGVCGLVLWFLANFASFPSTSTTRLMWTSGGVIESYFGLYYKVQPITIGGLNIYRNTSFFPEAPMAAVFYGIILCMGVLLEKKRKAFVEVVLIFCLLSTFSTSAYVYIIFTYMAYFLMSIDFMRSKKKITILSFFILLSVVSIYVVFSIVSDKIRSSDSGMTHLFDFIQGIHIWGDAPLYGFGFESDDYIWQNYLSAFRSGLGYTSGMLFLAIHGGLLTLLCFFVPFVLWSTNPVSQKTRLFPIFLLIIFLTVVVQNSGIFIFCLSLGYANYIWRNKRTEV